jgi:hypothetical protein
LRKTLLLLISGLCFSWHIGPAQAQSDEQVGALVEALRLAAPQTGREDDNLYSEWQIKPENIPRWSRLCTGQELSVAEFEADAQQARSILVCVMRDVLQEEYGSAQGDESIAVRRSASWWMTGDPEQYNSGQIAAYTERVLSFYQQQQYSRVDPPARATARPPSGSSGPSTQANQDQNLVFDRYMRAGYAATEERDYDTALLYFRRALDERPNDPYAQRAIQNVQNYIN